MTRKGTTKTRIDIKLTASEELIALLKKQESLASELKHIARKIGYETRVWVSYVPPDKEVLQNTVW